MPEEVQTEESQEAEIEDKDELESALEGSQEGIKETEEEGKEEEEGKTEEGEKKEEEEQTPDPVGLLQEEIKDLRQMVRASKREQTILQARLERLGEKPARVKDEDEDEDDEDEAGEKKRRGKKEESLSTVEELQGAIAQIGAVRGASLDILLETMEQSPKYADIRGVCSRGNFDDIFEVIATEATKDGGNLDEALLKIELDVWNKTNPYKYMYNLIKKYHPAYAEKEEKKGKEKKKDKTPAKAAGTIADKGGDSNIKSGWTAKRIDDLPEDELYTVPKEVYDKYMRDELD